MLGAVSRDSAPPLFYLGEWLVGAGLAGAGRPSFRAGCCRRRPGSAARGPGTARRRRYRRAVGRGAGRGAAGDSPGLRERQDVLGGRGAGRGRHAAPLAGGRAAERAAVDRLRGGRGRVGLGRLLLRRRPGRRPGRGRLAAPGADAARGSRARHRRCPGERPAVAPARREPALPRRRRVLDPAAEPEFCRGHVRAAVRRAAGRLGRAGPRGSDRAPGSGGRRRVDRPCRGRGPRAASRDGGAARRHFSC